MSVELGQQQDVESRSKPVGAKNAENAGHEYEEVLKLIGSFTVLS